MAPSSVTSLISSEKWKVDQANLHIWFTTKLLLWQNDLCWLRIIGIWNRMAHNTYCTWNFSNLFDLLDQLKSRRWRSHLTKHVICCNTYLDTLLRIILFLIMVKHTYISSHCNISKRVPYQSNMMDHKQLSCIWLFLLQRLHQWPFPSHQSVPAHQQIKWKKKNIARYLRVTYEHPINSSVCTYEYLIGSFLLWELVSQKIKEDVRRKRKRREETRKTKWNALN